MKVLFPPASSQLHLPLLPLLSDSKAQISFLPATLLPWPPKDPTHSEYLEFGKMAQLLGSSEDQLGALGIEGISQKWRTPNLIRKQVVRYAR